MIAKGIALLILLNKYYDFISVNLQDKLRICSIHEYLI